MIWFVENWRLIVDIISIIVVVVFFFIRKNVKIVDSVKALLIEHLPEVINRVEAYRDIMDPSRKLTGDEKLHLALDICKSYMVDELGMSESQLCLYTAWLIEHIEAILSTPKKKEENSNEI